VKPKSNIKSKSKYWKSEEILDWEPQAKRSEELVNTYEYFTKTLE